MEHTRLIRTVPAVMASRLAATSVAVAFVLLLLVAGPQRANASSETLKIDFDQSKVNISALKDLPLDTLASDASIEGTLYDNGIFNVPKGNFKMPELGITDPVAIRGFMGIESDATGHYDKTTGQLDLDAQAGLWVSVNIQQTLALLSGAGVDLGSVLGSNAALIGLIGNNLTCGFGPMDVHFTTESTSISKGDRFTKGPLGPGAITAEWSKLGPFAGQTKIFGIIDACTTIKSLLPGLLTSLGGQALGGVDLGSILNGVDLDNLDLGPSSVTLVRSLDENKVVVPDPDPDPEATAPDLKLKISPRSRRAKAGKTIKYHARVVNSGAGEAEGVSVCIKAPKKAVKVKKACQSYGTIAADDAKVRDFKLKVKPGSSGKMFKLNFITKTSAETKPKNTASLRIK